MPRLSMHVLGYSEIVPMLHDVRMDQLAWDQWDQPLPEINRSGRRETKKPAHQT